MAKAKRYTMEQVRDAQKILRSLAAKKTGKTRAEAVELLAGDIRRAMEKGHSLEEIRDTLAQAGIMASLSRMRTVLESAPPKGEEVGETKVAPAVTGERENEVRPDTRPALESPKPDYIDGEARA